MNKIELTDYEAESFIKFQKHRELFDALEACGALDVKGGSVLIHFSTFGDAVGIEKKEHFNVIRTIYK